MVLDTQVIVLNGGSSSGKTTIARCLQQILPRPWLAISVDDLVDALPPSLQQQDTGISFGERGEVEVGGDFHAIEAAWMTGIAAMARVGVGIIIDDVFLGGATSQARTAQHLNGLRVLWVGVRCDAQVASARELERSDRAAGMAATQAEAVHRGVEYDIEVDTTHTHPMTCARMIAGRV